MLKLWVILAASFIAATALAETDSAHVEAEVAAANRTINSGHVKDGLDRLFALLRQLDPAKDKEAYWRVSTTIVEFLSQVEDHASATKVLEALVAAKVPDGNPGYVQWMQFYAGRALAFSGKAADAEKFLRVLTASDARFIFNAPQRGAAFVLCQIELDRGNIQQSAIWMRRALIGTLVDKGASSEEIVDALTYYGFYLMRTRRLADANNLLFRLAPIYDAYFPNHGPKYIKFLSVLAELQSDVGNFEGADGLLKILRNTAAAVDIAPPTAKATVFYGDLYQLARSFSTDGREPLKKKVQEALSAYPDFFSKNLRARVNLAYFAVVSDNIDLADQLLSPADPATAEDKQFDAYVIALKSLIAARRDHFDESMALNRDALDRIISFHSSFEDESANRLPAISVPERAVLTATLALNISHISNDNEANTLFRLGQFLNRDKGKLGLNKKITQENQPSDLQREEVRSRVRLQELRDRLMYDAAYALFAQILPIRQPSISKNNDYSFLTRLENVEDRIATADQQLRQAVKAAPARSADDPADLAEVQRLIKPNEALVTHVMALGVLVTTCVTSNGWEFRPSKPDPADLQQITIDTKLLMAAVHGTHEPSPDLDSSFPLEGAHRLFKLYFGNISACLKNKTHILLATDPDLFTLPWNALLTEPPPEDNGHPLRDASWLPKSYAVSLLPSVRSLLQLRANLPLSSARQIFLGIGDPDFKGAPAPSAQLALGRLFASRGAGDSRAIADLPRLPESADELRAIASALGASPNNLLLRSDATERELRKHALNDYRVISFATHAIVKGEIDGVTEPALVLSPVSSEHNTQNDGLLTASEIQNLTLNANLIILSACNTAASDGQASGRGLSGLADAFFFAGARSIAVTQWAVYSEFAQKLAVGMIAQSLKSNSSGVSQGLRRAMTGYLSGVTADYLANPRFWAPFMIAGDGAVGPLDQAADDAASNRSVKLEWEYVADAGHSDIFGLAKSPANDGSFYTLGEALPLPGADRSGSYIGRLKSNHRFAIVDRNSDLAAQNILSIGQNIAVLGYLRKSSTSSIGQFRMLSGDRKELWRFDENPENWSFPVTILRKASGYTLISTETNFGAADGNAVVISEVSEQGVRLSSRRYPLPLGGILTSTQRVTEDDKGRLIIAVSGNRPALPSSPSRMWTNPQTGSKRFCLSSASTVIIALDRKSLDVLAQKEIEATTIAALQMLDGTLYAASNYTQNCNIAKNIRISELDDKLDLHTLYESKNANSLEAFDFLATPRGFILVGSVQSFVPTAVTTKYMTLEELQNYKPSDPWAESTWELTEERSGAFVMAVGRDGLPQSDRVFADLRSRRLSRIVADSDDHFVAVGSAFGGRGWLVDFRLSDETSLTARLQAAWRNYVIQPAMNLLPPQWK